MKDQIRDELIQRIVSGQLKPGDRLKEAVIAEEMQTSQAPVREAIRCLEVLGYVDHKPHVGARVKSFNLQEFLEVYEIREALEVYAARAARDDLKGKLKSLRHCLDRMKEGVERSDIAAFSVHDARFHRTIIETLGNRAMLKILDTLTVQEQVAATIHETRMTLTEALANHYPIVDAIEAGSWDEVCECISDHYQTIKQYI